jgi:anti-sigma regulatory factor (Ser/Thr protein kinase)
VEVITATGRPIVLAIDDATMAGEARRHAVAMAARLGFDETGRGNVAIVATEAATNLAKHATGGQIVVQGLENGATVGIDILALDGGPGMADVDRCLVDGYSTAGSPGKGLGAMARMSALFDIDSRPETGTGILARLWSVPPSERLPAPEVGAVSLPMPGEEVCGDHWGIADVDGRISVLVVDGLGHGPQAAEAAREALRVFGETSSRDPGEIIQAAHTALRATRGAAVAIARIDPERGELRYAGVGNIAGAILGGGDGRSTSMVSRNGIVGHTIRKVQEFNYAWARGSVLVMHSDGLGSQWQLGSYPGLAHRHPGLVAGVLYRDFKRGRDDVTVVVVREGSAGPP